MTQRVLCVVLSMFMSFPSLAATRKIEVPIDTRVYVVTLEQVVGKKKFIQEGQQIPCEIWRDVVYEGQVLFEAGTPVVARVDRLKKAKVAGVRGKLEIGAYETSSVDGQNIQLTGGYMKAGKGKIALSATLGFLFLPLIFIKGKAARLPAGTVFDAYTGVPVTLELAEEAAPVIVDLSDVLADLTVEVLYDELEGQEKPEDFDFLIRAPAEAPAKFVIDRINGEATDPIELRVISRVEADVEAEIRATVSIKTLAKRFTKGINRFDVAYTLDGERVATEVVLDVQF